MRTLHIACLGRRRLCGAGVLALLGPAFGAEAPRPAPAEIANAIASPRLQGSGKLRFFGLLVYEARLWASTQFVPQPFDAHAFGLELHYARKLEGAAIAQRSIVEMRRAGGLDDRQAQSWQAALTSAFPNVVPGDRLTGLHVPGEATRFFHNGRPTATVADPLFARAFFGIWLADTSSEPDLRRQLIGPSS